MPDNDLGTPFLRFERRGSIAWCIVDRPKARNALTSAMYFGIRHAVDIVDADPDLAALIITGVGDVFIPGGDMGGPEVQNDSTFDKRTLGFMGSDVLPFRTIRQSRVPVVAAVNGLCQGGGFIITMLCDVAVASDRAVFRGPETLRGIVDGNLASILPAHVGIANARDILMTGRRVGADEARSMGLISRVAPHDELEAEATRAATELLLAAPEARFQVKRLINEAYRPVDQMTFDASIQKEEVREGFTAFLEKRTPSWVPEELQTGERL